MELLLKIIYKTALDYANEKNYPEIAEVILNGLNQEYKLLIKQKIKVHQNIQFEMKGKINHLIKMKQLSEKNLKYQLKIFDLKSELFEYEYLREINDKVKEILNHS